MVLNAANLSRIDMSMISYIGLQSKSFHDKPVSHKVLSLYHLLQGHLMCSFTPYLRQNEIKIAGGNLSYTCIMDTYSFSRHFLYGDTVQTSFS